MMSQSFGLCTLVPSLNSACFGFNVAHAVQSCLGAGGAQILLQHPPQLSSWDLKPGIANLD